MGGSTDSDDWLACVEKFRDVLGLISARLAEAGSDKHQICRLKVLPTPHSSLIVRINVLALGIPCKKNLAVETVLLGEDLGQHGHAFLSPVLFVTGYQDDGLSLARAFLTRKVQNLMMIPKQGKNRR